MNVVLINAFMDGVVLDNFATFLINNISLQILSAAVT